ncbi:MAG: DUF5615 family PIN-like protein, partial [Pirellulales bacterium]
MPGPTSTRTRKRSIARSARTRRRRVARLYANENFPFPVVDELRRRGHDAITVAETGKA